MLNIIYASLLIGLIIIPIPLLIIANRRSKKKAFNNLLQQLHSVAEMNSLNYTSQEVLKSSVIGVDGVQRRLAIVEKVNERDFKTKVVDLENVVQCHVNKQYRKLPDKNLPLGKAEMLLENISLHLVFSGQPPIDIPFYNYIEDSIFMLQSAEAKAKYWEVLLAQLHAPLVTVPKAKNIGQHDFIV